MKAWTYGMILGFALGLGSVGCASSGGSDIAETESSLGATLSPELERNLSFDGSVITKAGPSAHASTFTIRVGRMTHPYGNGLVLFFQEMIPDGICLKHTVFDFETHELVQTPQFGNPGCRYLVAQPTRLLPNDASYEAELRRFRASLGAAKGFQPRDGSASPEKLNPAVELLDAFLATLAAPTAGADSRGVQDCERTGRG